jgi:hypothetical protein
LLFEILPLEFYFGIREDLGRIVRPDFREVVFMSKAPIVVSISGAQGRSWRSILMVTIFISLLAVHSGDPKSNLNGRNSTENEKLILG